MPSTMSTRTTSPRPHSARRWAVVAPTLPPPTTVILGRALFLMTSPARRSGALPHVLDDGVPELGALQELRAGHLALQVVRDALLPDGLLEPGDNQGRRLVPAEVLEHQHARED